MISKRVIQTFQSSNRFLLVTHQTPDVDGAGAVAALALVLRSMGKEAWAVSVDPAPAIIRYYTEGDLFTSALPETFIPDVIVMIDTSDMNHLDAAVRDCVNSFRSVPLVLIDHHLTQGLNSRFRVIDPNASSSCELLFSLIRRLPTSLSSNTASLLLAGIIADSGRFRYSYTRSQTLRAAAALMEAGADLFFLNEQFEKVFSFEGLRLWGEIIDNARSLLGGKVIWTQATSEMLSSVSNPAQIVSSDLFNFFLRSVDCDLVVLFEEMEGKVRVHIRSTKNIDSSRLAKAFGGGGHARAAGCRIPGSLAEAEDRVLNFVRAELAQLVAAT